MPRCFDPEPNEWVRDLVGRKVFACRVVDALGIPWVVLHPPRTITAAHTIYPYGYVAVQFEGSPYWFTYHNVRLAS